MPDLVYLSLWLHDFNESNMLEYWRRAIEAFPVTSTAPSSSLAIHPFDWSETPVFERNFGEGSTAEDMVALAVEFLHDDYAYDVEMNWELWLPVTSAEAGNGAAPSGEEEEIVEPYGEEGEEEEEMDMASDFEWRRSPSAVALTCLGPEFAREDSDDRPNLQINFGLDSPFLPPDEEEMLESEADPEIMELRTRENLQQLVEFVHHLDEILPVKKRLLWCESGENLAEKILGAWNLRL